MAFDEEKERERLVRYLNKRKRATEGGNKKKKARKDAAVVGPSIKVEVLGSDQGLASALDRKGVALGLNTPDAAQVSYPRSVEIFMPNWDFKINESASANLVSAEKYMEGCVPPVDERLVAGYDDTHLRSLMAHSLSSALFLAREQSQRLIKADKTQALDTSLISELKTSIEEYKSELDRVKLKHVQREHNLVEELGALKLKAIELERNIGTLAADKDAKVKELEELEDGHTESMFRCYKMGWNDMKQNVLERYFFLDLSGIEPSLRSPEASPSGTVVAEEGSDASTDTDS